MPTLFDLYGIDLGEPDAPPPPEKSGFLRRVVGDTAVTAVKSAIGLPEMAVGLGSLVSGGRAGKAAEEAGFRPREAREFLDTLYSPEQQAANREVQQAQGFIDTASAAIRNPSTIYHAVVESAPSLLPAAGIARGIAAVAPKAGLLGIGVGEGAVSAGATAEQIRQQTQDGLLTGEQSLLAAGAGALTGLIGGVAGKIANKLGIGDVQQLLAGVEQAGPQAQKALSRALLEGFATEGILQELPQSAQEQIAQNVALGKPWDEGVGNAAAMGALAGGVMGGGVAAFTRRPAQPEPQPDPVDQALDTLASTKDVGQMIQAAETVAAAPLAPLSMSPDQEAAAMTAFEELAKADLTDMKNMGRLDKSPTRGAAPQPAAQMPGGQASAQFVEDAPFLDRLMSVREQLQDPKTRERIRAAGPDALSTILYYVEQAGREGGMDGIPEATRERMLDLAEYAVGRARLTPQAPQATIEGPAATQRLTATEGPKQIGLDTTPTGVLRADAAGNVAPETRADVISDRQRNAPPVAPPRSDGMDQQARRASAVFGEPNPRQPAPPVNMPERRHTDGQLITTPLDLVMDYVNTKRQENTPAARLFVKEFEAGRITRRDVVRAMQTAPADPLAAIKPGTPPADPVQQRLERAAQQAPAQTPGLVVEPIMRARARTVEPSNGPGSSDVARPDGRGPVDPGSADRTDGVVPSQQQGSGGVAGEPVSAAVERPGAVQSGRGGDEALNRIASHLEAGKPLAVKTEGDGRITVGPSVDAATHIELQLTVPERKAFKRAQADEELAETQQERAEARAAVQAAVLPATQRALEGGNGATPTPTDTAANQAATSPANDLPEPTQAQKEAGNYKVGRIKVAGLDISVENPAGSERAGVDPDGKAWRNTLAHHYGYIRRSEGADGDHVDVFVNPGTPEDYEGTVFVVDQSDPKTGRFDEHKVMMGFPSAKAAQEAYQANYAKGWKGLRAVQPMSMEQFKAWVSDPANTRKPAAKGGPAGKGEQSARPDELVELRKRESVLKSLRECLG